MSVTTRLRRTIHEWNSLASAWIEAQGEKGDWNRRVVLDPIVLSEVGADKQQIILDIGCGEARFCRMLMEKGYRTVGVDISAALVEHAKFREPNGELVIGQAESLPFLSSTFNCVICYGTLVSVSEIEATISEIQRVLKPGGKLIIANLNSFITCDGMNSWVRGITGRLKHYKVDNYFNVRSYSVKLGKSSMTVWHRPMSLYFSLLLSNGLKLEKFHEPTPNEYSTPQGKLYWRVPYFHIMSWIKNS